MKVNKRNIIYWLVSGLLAIFCMGLFIYTITAYASLQEDNYEWLVFAGIFLLMGLICMLFLNKKLFLKLYNRLLPSVEKGEEWTGARVASEKKARRTLFVVVIAMLVISLVFLIVFDCIYLW